MAIPAAPQPLHDSEGLDASDASAESDESIEME